MSEIEKITQAVFGDTPVRTGYSTDVGASFVVAADLRGAMKHSGSTHMFVKSLEERQEAAGQSKGGNNSSPLYVGTETIQTAGGPQQMKVIYKRGVFHLLMLSRKPEATQYRDKIFDVLEEIEREGFYIKEKITEEQLEAARMRINELDSLVKMHEISAEGEEARGRKQFLNGVRAGRNNPDLDYHAIYEGRFVKWEQADEDEDVLL